MARFTATHGVQFADSDKRSGALRVWAHFTRDHDLDTPDGRKVYVFETDDDKVADRLRKVSDYGIAEVAPAAEVPDPAGDE